MNPLKREKRLITAVSPAGGAQGPKHDQVTGTGQGVFPALARPPDFANFVPLSSQAHVNAKGGPTDAEGHVWADFDTTSLFGFDVLIKLSVFCVDADGNQAIVGAIVEKSNTPNAPPGSFILRKVIDNGQGSDDPSDRTGATAPVPKPESCPAPADTPIPTGAVDEGNFVVKDGE